VAAVPSGLSRHAWVILLFHWHKEERNSSDTVVIKIWAARSDSISLLLGTSRNISLLQSIETRSKYAQPQCSWYIVWSGRSFTCVPSFPNSTGVKNAWNYSSIPCNCTGRWVINNFEL